MTFKIMRNHRPWRSAAAWSAMAAWLFSPPFSAVHAADPAPFDLAGPQLKVTVTRGKQTLPIGQVPNLAEGDRLDIGADLPADQSANYLLVSAFLHGATNPPPKDWIDSAKTWKRKDKDKSLRLTVPAGARQLVLFMVPETGGDFGTVADAVRGKPGEFVRVTQDLNQASLDRSRLDAFMAGIRAQENTHPEYLRTLAPALAGSLSIKLNADCLAKVVELQAACLLENRDALVLSDVHSRSITDTLTGAPADLALQISATPQAGLGYYSPYIAVVRDVARIFGAFNNPEFQYLPALGVRQDDRVSLILNSAPSFSKPKSVLVAALPAVEAENPPPLRAAGKAALCASRPGMVLPVEGAPLIYSTGYAHGMTLQATDRNGKAISVPLIPRADKGGYALKEPLQAADFNSAVTASLNGFWGFRAFTGPSFTLQFPNDQPWHVADDAQSLIVGRENQLSLQGAAASCIESISLQQPSGPEQSASWKATEADRIAVTLPMASTAPGKLTLNIRQYGVAKPTSLTLQAYAEASRLDGLTLHAGDDWGVLTGRRLDQVARIDIDGTPFRPGELRREGDVDKLRIQAEESAKPPALSKEQSSTARLTLKDGRVVSLPATIQPPRLRVSLLSKTIDRGPDKAALPLRLTDANLLPDDARITLSVKATGGTRFTSQDALEIATPDQSASLRLTGSNGLRLESAEVAIASFDAAQLGASTAGPLLFRLVQNGIAADWQPLATLARLPQITAMSCPADKDSCSLSGTNLFLIDAVANSTAFGSPSPVPEGFTERSLDVPKPLDGKLFVKLRDAPGTIAEIAVPGAS
jgi:hypothetical protein